jgi:ABC-2 type transport system permease protein
MTQLAVERIKLFSTRSPWWCMAMALGLTVGFTAIIAANSNVEFPLTVQATQFTHTFGLYVIMVMAALAITTEYRFGTIRATFQAVPNRFSPLVAKAVVVAVLAGIVGEITAFASWGTSRILQPDMNLALDSANDWRHVAGVGLVYAVGAVLALAVGLLVRQTAAAVAIILVFPLLVESLVGLIPKIGTDIQEWLPFQSAGNFVLGSPDASGRPVEAGPVATDLPLGPWGSLAYFTAISVGLLVVALVVTNKRDA